ncbi:MAG: GGDEF domain-containing protein [Burkholderiaceae bacterium]
MQSVLNLDQQTLFIVNALLLVVFAVAFAFAGVVQKDRRYWTYLVASNVCFAIAFALFSRRIGAAADALLLPNGLLVIGLGLRWRAIRTFFGHRSSSVWFIVLSLVMVQALVLSDTFGIDLIFGSTNALIAAQIIVIMVAIAREREPLPSRWGLILAYGAVAASSALRAIQGWFLEPEMGSLLPADIFLDINLIAAVVHIAASGAFSLSIAYERSVAKLRETALRDPLTGLYNRWSIETLPEVDKRRGAREIATLVLVDIDHFKHVNDNHGHAAGDAAIQHCADLLRRTFGDDDGLIARIGGEEFIVLLPGRDLAYSRERCEKLRAAIENEPLRFRGQRIELTISIGISHGSMDADSFPRLLELADKCLYRAKARGRNRIEIGDPSGSTIGAH